MKPTVLCFLFVACLFLCVGCSNDDALRPTQSGDDMAVDLRHGPYDLAPGGLYSLAWMDVANGIYGGFERINQHSGLATPVWTLSGQDSWVVDPPTLWGPSPVGFAFDLDGTMYTIIGVYYVDDTLAQSRFAKIDATTGVVTFIGDPVPWNYCGADIDSRGDFYVCGMDVPHLGYIHGPGAVFRVDKVTGEFTEIGATVWNGPDILIDPPVYHGETVTDWMDLAFDSHDQLYGTTRNKLFKISTTTGEITDVIPIVGVPGDPPPPPYTLIQEVMTIAFDEHDVLFGTAINVEWDTGHGAPVVKINTTTGQATFLGYTEQQYNHGGDILPEHVNVMHRMKSGGSVLLRVSMSALPAHLAHGDHVPGTAGHPYD